MHTLQFPLFPLIAHFADRGIWNAGRYMMIHGRYGLLIGLSIVAMLGVAAGAGLFLAYAPLPDPSAATSEQIFRWLVTRDMSREPIAVRQAIVDRLDAGLGQTNELAENVARLDDSQRATLWTNIGVLLDPWLLEKVDEYAKCPAGEQPAYLDRFLDRVEQWSKIGAACLRGQAGNEAKGDASLSKLIADRIAECSRRAGPAERKQISAFMAAVQARWIWRKFSGIRLFGKP
jgi:hypothetical protein